MLRYAGGDMEAFQGLYERHRGGLYRYFLRQSNQSVAEELFQDVWMRVVQSRKRYRPKAAFSTWLYTLARNRMFDHWRRAGVRPVENTGSGDDSPGITIPDANPGPQRLVDLRDCLAEIADTMNTGAETAKSRLRYAMDRLRSAIAKECLEGEL